MVSGGVIATMFDEVTQDNEGGTVEAPTILESETLQTVLHHLTQPSETDELSTMDHPGMVEEAEAIDLVQRAQVFASLGWGCRKRRPTAKFWESLR